MSAPLRFAIMLQTNSLKLWQVDVVLKLIDSGIATPVLLIMNDGFLNEYNSSVHTNHLLYRLYEKMFLRTQYLFNVPLPKQFNDIDTIYCRTEKKGRFSEYFSKQDIETIHSYQADFILRFGFSIIRGEILNVAKYGVWSFHHSDEQIIRGGPAGFYEVLNKHKINGVILQKLTNHLDGGIILKKRYYKTVLHDYVFHLNKILGASTDMPLQVCRDILNNTAEYFDTKPSASKAKVFTIPDNFKMLRFINCQVYRRIHRFLLEILIHERWAIGIADKPIDAYVDSGFVECDTWFAGMNKKQYVADPFAIETKQGYRIFFEQYYYAKGKAGLSFIDVSELSKFETISTLLHDNTHYSFPFIIEHQHETYILPEQHQKNNLQLYRLNKEKNQLLSSVNLLSEQTLIDPILHYDGHYWWLFGTENGLHSNEKLHIYFSDNIDGKYTAHPQNPVKVNPNGARMAGPIQSINGKLLRFAQDSSDYYGKRIAVFEIRSLSTTRYEETFCKYIQSANTNKFNKGIHTISTMGTLTLIDSKTHIVSWDGFRYKLGRKFKIKKK
jgi:hypothetical protein